MNLNFFKEINQMNLDKNISKSEEKKDKNTLESSEIININDSEKMSDKLNIKNIDKVELDLAKKLGAIEEYTLDRFEENFAVLENRKTKEIENIDISKIPNGVKEGDILKKINGKFYLDKIETEKVKNEISEKYKNLWN